MSILSIDFETRSTCDLKKTGVYKYAEDPNTDIWCMAWAFDDEEPEIWVPGMTLDVRIYQHIADRGEVRAWNAQFERIIWRAIMVNRYGAPIIALEQWHDTAAEAAAMALPRSLDEAARITKVGLAKDSEGYNLMMRMTRPRKIHPDGTLEWWDVPDRVARLHEYCKQDVRVERAIYKAVRRLTPTEREIYLLDQRINDRGVGIDLALVDAAQEIVIEGVARANAALYIATGGEVAKVTNFSRLTTWLQSKGVETDGVSKAAVRELLEREDLPAEVEQALTLRAEAGRSSVAKLTSFRQVACDDGRAHGLLFYHGASTGRWTGKLLQPHNFPRPEDADPERFIPLIMAGEYDLLDLLYPPVAAIVDCLRSMLVAGPGMELIAADFSAIEARVVNWLAGQWDYVQLFAEGKDVYKVNAAKLYGIPIEEVQKFPHRQTGKFQELGCGFGMGAAKAVTAAKDVYGLDLPPELAKEIVDSYRETHPEVKNFWYGAERACIAAVKTPGVVQTFGGLKNLKAIKAGAYLYIILPSGRPLCYAAPTVEWTPPPWAFEMVDGVMVRKPEVEDKETLFFWGVDGFSKKWGKLKAYGGLLVENIVQAVARDLMAEGMLRAEVRGYPPILSVHDEVVAEVPAGFGSVQEFEALLCETPDWAQGCPVAAEGWRGQRYRK